jgi:hypothetical protein
LRRLCDESRAFAPIRDNERPLAGAGV